MPPPLVLRSPADSFVQGTLRGGTDLLLGLDDDYAVTIDMNYRIPEPLQSQVVDRCSEIRASRETNDT
ncbi:MAG: hypothetical protein ACRDNY_11330 [Gaiellaceae bacterium]